MKDWSMVLGKKELLKHMGSVSQLGGLKRYVFTEGRAKGVEAVDVVTGSGLDFTACDAVQCDIGFYLRIGKAHVFRVGGIGTIQRIPPYLHIAGDRQNAGLTGGGTRVHGHRTLGCTGGSGSLIAGDRHIVLQYHTAGCGSSRLVLAGYVDGAAGAVGLVLCQLGIALDGQQAILGTGSEAL